MAKDTVEIEAEVKENEDTLEVHAKVDGEKIDPIVVSKPKKPKKAKKCAGGVKVYITRNFVTYDEKQYNVGDTPTICKKAAEGGVKRGWCKVL